MTNQLKLGSGNTTISNANNQTIITFWNTVIVTFDAEKIILNTGGYFTATTKTRMNQAGNQFNLGYSVYQEKYTWFCTFKGETKPFNGDKLELIR